MQTIQEEINKAISKGRNKCSSMRRTKRLIKKWYNFYLDRGYLLYFATFTFKSEEFNRKQFVDYLRRKCKVNCILNADWGKVNNRFHLHGFIATKYELELSENLYDKFGFTKIEKARNECCDYIVKYSVKFNNNFPKFRIIIINQK